MRYKDYYFVVDSIEEVETLREKYGNVIWNKGTPEMEEKDVVYMVDGVQNTIHFPAKPAVGNTNKFYVLARTDKSVNESAVAAEKTLVEELTGIFA